ncbi:hypothetical protein [Nitrincola sp. A-D6]|uniref:hypothetical protein n=1 Tax=Nitrincola sp. A-D6 TaxID=1545442 RepID=UPI0011870B09|nr:hypothetical protein [Nitrincola sp. A-D6]
MISYINWKKPLLIAVVFLIMLVKYSYETPNQGTDLSLRQIYSQSSDSWPAPWIDTGVNWQELAYIPSSHPLMLA